MSSGSHLDEVLNDSELTSWLSGYNGSRIDFSKALSIEMFTLKHFS